MFSLKNLQHLRSSLTFTPLGSTKDLQNNCINQLNQIHFFFVQIFGLNKSNLKLNFK